ncbi:TetR/AcrR family transcriptional regulator [Sphingosinicella sp.]|uniref:TetR/AcrR family transcriptional regulator n=1 Tax=Sphingosinicella sp. TaxID=1917971 RepID=UPI00403771D2
MPAKKPLAIFRRQDWVDLAVKTLRLEGPARFTVDHLCRRAHRTKGSFYHHFKGIEELTGAVARAWAEAESESVGRAASVGSKPLERLRALLALTETADHRLERGVRALTLNDAELSEIVRKADDRRELVTTTLLAAAYGIKGAEAHAFARLFHAIHLAAPLRSPDDAAGFAKPPSGALLAILQSNFPTG